MKSWPTWLKVLAATIGIALVVGFSQLLLFLDKLSASKFDL